MPADFAMMVLVKMPLLHPRMSDSDWISEAKELHPGLLVARTLLPHGLIFSAVAMLNVSGKDQAFCHDTQIGIATPCQTTYVSMVTDAKMTCVRARQCGADVIGVTAETARCSDSQTANFGRLAVRDGPPVGPDGLQAGSVGPKAGREGRMVGGFDRWAVTEGRSVAGQLDHLAGPEDCHAENAVKFRCESNKDCKNVSDSCRHVYYDRSIRVGRRSNGKTDMCTRLTG